MANKESNYSRYVVDEDDNLPGQKTQKKVKTDYSKIIEETKLQGEDENENDILPQQKQRVIDTESDYQKRKYNQRLSPEKEDRSYRDRMKEQLLESDSAQLKNELDKIKQQQMEEGKFKEPSKASKPSKFTTTMQQPQSGHSTDTDWNDANQTPKLGNKWDTPSHKQANESETPRSVRARRKWDATPSQETPSRKIGSKFGETPTPSHFQSLQTPGTVNRFGETPGSKRLSNQRWDDKTPVYQGGAIAQTPMGMAGMTPSGQTPMNYQNMTAEDFQKMRIERDIDYRNRPLADDELDSMLPGNTEGYEVMKVPESYIPALNPATKLLQLQQTPSMQTPSMYNMPSDTPLRMEVPGTPSQGLPGLKPEDYKTFAPLLEEKSESELSEGERKERKILMLLLKIKNGTPQQRKSAMRQITQNARELGAGPLFNQILPILMEPSLEVQERHLLVKVIDRILYKLDELVKPYVQKVLVVIEPLLIDEDYYARVEGREIISNLAKAAGLATMITKMRPDIDHQDEYVRNTTARAFAVVAQALGIPALLPFLKAVCQTKKNWQARHTGIKIVQQISILMGCAILPHLKGLVEIIEHGLEDEQPKVKTITALALAALAEAATPYGIEAFDTVLYPLWNGIQYHRGKSLGAFLKAIGYIIPLMDTENALEYTKFVMPVLINQFTNQEEEMKKVVLKVVKQCVSCPGVDANYIRTNLVDSFFKDFWVKRMAQDKRNYKQLIDTTIEIATKIGGAQVIQMIVHHLKDDNEAFRKMVMETLEKVVAGLGVSDIDQKLEDQIMDGIISAFHEQGINDDSQVMLNGFGTVVNSLGLRAKPHFPSISAIIHWRLNNKSARVRQQAADLVARIALCAKNCGEESRLEKLGTRLYECLGEEYPEVLGSILGGLKAIVNVLGMNQMKPPIKDLLPSLTPILKNRHEKVQENTIDLVGRIADRGAEHVSPKEWMRICFDLLDLLKAHKKGIRRATVNTFGYIAKAIGPQDVLVTLLNNLKVQERQLRVCTTVAIAIVAETCGPYTVLPALMNEYRVQELNVQNGVLKSLSFMFEYVGEVAKDYIYSIITLLEDALTDRDLVHRQTAATTIKHLALGVQGFGCEDALTNLMNYIFPNIFETSPHVVNAITDAIDSMRVSLGPGVILLYLIQGMFHPARRVRQVYWRLYNMVYVGNQDSLVAFYPELDPDPKSFNDFKRYELYNML